MFRHRKSEKMKQMIRLAVAAVVAVSAFTDAFATMTERLTFVGGWAKIPATTPDAYPGDGVWTNTAAAWKGGDGKQVQTRGTDAIHCLWLRAKFIMPADWEKDRLALDFHLPLDCWSPFIGANVGYGQPDATPGTIEAAVAASALGPVVVARPDGLEAPTGHGGAFLSGGEGQRVRVARALARDGVRLVIADEPFRGLDRSTRVELAARCRDRWRDATVLWATHDMDEVDGFDLVVVVEDGEIVEAGPPGSLGPGSRYRALVAADDDLRRDGWAGAGWRTVRVDGGRASTIPTGTDVR